MAKSIVRKRINSKAGPLSGGGGGSGTVTQIDTTGPILGGPITTSGTISFDEGANFTWTGTHAFTVDLPTSAIVPTGASDLVNKAYVDSLIAGLSPQPSVLVATIAPLPACTPAGAGVGKTLTMNAVGILTVDGVATVLGDNILVKDQADPVDNGVYTVTTEGTAGVAAVITRRANYDQTAEVVLGTMFGVSQGTQAGTVWVMISPNPVVVDTDDINFTYFLTGATYSAGTGLTLAGSTFTVDLDAAGAIIFNGNELAVNPDGVTIDIVGNALTFIGGSTNVTNNSVVAGATVTAALNNLAAAISPDFQTVLTNGNSTSLTAIFDDGAGVVTSYSPGLIENDTTLNINSQVLIVNDVAGTVPLLTIDTTTGLYVLGDYTGGLTSPCYVGVQPSNDSGFIITSTAFIQVNGGGNEIGLQADSVQVAGASTVGINTLTGGYTIPVADGTAGQILTTDGAGASSWEDPVAAPVIVPITAAALKVLRDGGTLNTEAIYYVTDAGEGTSTIVGTLYIRAHNTSTLQPFGQGTIQNDETISAAIPATLGYDVDTNKFTAVIDPVRNNKIYCGLNSQTLLLDDSVLPMFHFDDDDWRDNTINCVQIDNANGATSMTLKGCNWETAWIDLGGFSNLEFINTSIKGVANQLSGVPDLEVTGDTASFECNDFYGNDSDYGITGVGQGADITYIRLGWFSTLDMTDTVNADFRFNNIGSTAYVEVETDQSVRYCEFGNGIHVHIVGATRNCNFLSGDQGGTLGVIDFKGLRSTLINCSYGGGNDLTTTDSILTNCTVTGGAGDNNTIINCNLTDCTINFAGNSECSLNGVTAIGRTFTFTGDGNLIGSSTVVPVYADDTARDAAITLPVEGMIILSGNKFQGYTGGWNDLN